MAESDDSRARAASRVDAFEEALADCIDRLTQDGAETIETVTRDHPEHAPALRRHLERLRGLDLVRDRALGSDEPRRLGDFTLLRPIGRGGMGVVHLARQESLGRDVALKIIRSDCLDFPAARDRFRREVEAIARLEHPSIVRIHAVGAEGDMPYFAMEWIAGASVADVLRHLGGSSPERLAGRDFEGALRAIRPEGGEPAAPAEIFGASWVDLSLRIAKAVAEALEHAHRRGVIHRDVKPSNVLVSTSGRVCLADFGLASVSGSDTLTRSATPLGSLPYMSPEQVAGARDGVDERTDVYSLGVLLYELLTLRPPYLSDSSEATRREILAATPASLRARNRAVPWEVETICLKAMSPEPERRYASAAALAADLENALRRRPIAARRAGPLLRARRFAQRHPMPAVAGIFLVLLAATVIVAIRSWGGQRKLDELLPLGHILYLVRSAEDFRPADSAKIVAMRKWREEAAGLFGLEAEHAASIADLERRASHWSDAERARDRRVAEADFDFYASIADSLRDAARSEADLEAVKYWKRLSDEARRRMETRATFDFESAEDRFRHMELSQVVSHTRDLRSHDEIVRGLIDVAEQDSALEKRLGPFGETVRLRSGPPGEVPARVSTRLPNVTCLASDREGRPLRDRAFRDEDFAAADSSDVPAVVVSVRAFAGPARLPGDPYARWIHSTSEASGWGSPARSVLYSLPFEVKTSDVSGARLRFDWCTDDGLGDGRNLMGVYLNGEPLPAEFNGGMMRVPTSAVADVTRLVRPGANRLYVYQGDAGGGVCCTMFSATIDVAGRR